MLAEPAELPNLHWILQQLVDRMKHRRLWVTTESFSEKEVDRQRLLNTAAHKLDPDTHPLTVAPEGWSRNWGNKDARQGPGKALDPMFDRLFMFK